MPSVNSSTESPFKITRSLKDLEEELRADNKRVRERAQQQVEDAEEAFARAHAKHERDYEASLSDIKNAANEDMARERASTQAELDQMKKETYSKLGRLDGAEKRINRDQYDALKKTSESKMDSDRQILEDTEKYYEKRLAEQTQQHEKDLESMTKRTRETADRAYSESEEHNQAKFEEYKKTAEKDYRNLIKDQQQTLNLERKRNQKAIDDVRADVRNISEKALQDADIRTEKAANASARRSEEATQGLQKSHEEETSLLRQELSDLHRELARNPMDKSQGIRDAIATYENDHRKRENQIIDNYENQAAKAKEQYSRAERHYQDQASEAISERDRYYAKIFSANNEKAHSAESTLLDNFERSRAQQENQLQAERALNRHYTEVLNDQAREKRVEALANQAAAYQATLDRNHKVAEEEKQSLQKALKEAGHAKYGADTISPKAEESLRQTVTKDYEKILATEKDRHNQAFSSAQETHSQRINDIITRNETEQARLHREYTTAREAERWELMNQIQEAEQSKAEALRNRDQDSARQTHTLTQSHSNMLEKQRRAYDEAMQNIKNDAAYKLNAQRQESEFELRTARREFNSLQNQIIREHEKKMSEFKAQYDAQIEDLKTQSNFALHDMEKKGKLALDEQARTYEQRLSQLEQQHKERERYLTENFQEQLEKVKRSNALNYSKKG